MPATPVRIALVGAGRIGAAHAATIARRVPEADLVAVVDPRPGAAEAVAGPYGALPALDVTDVLDQVDAVAVTASATVHHQLIRTAAEAEKHVFCEKPAGMSLAEIDDATAAAAKAGVVFQVGFNRRFAPEFAAARAAITDGRIGTVQLLRSLTRDPGSGPADPTAVPLWTIFTQTLIHDFDTLNWLNPAARAVDVLATADALIAPEVRDTGHLDTAVVTIRYDNGAIATAEASFAAAYGYDVRGEVFGSAGMVSMGDGSATSLRLHDITGRTATTSRSDVDLMAAAYTGEFIEFAHAIHEGRAASVGGADAFAAFAIAEACIESMKTGARAAVATEVPA